MGAASFVPDADRDWVLARLRRQPEYVEIRSELYAGLFAEHGVGASTLLGLEYLRRFPFTDKQMLRDGQAASPPLGRHAAVPMSEVIRVHASTGTTGTPNWVGVTRADAAAWTAMNVAALRTERLT